MQVGDPFMEKVLIECCLELFAADLVVGIQDLGGAGLSCATSELASAGDGGMRVELDTVPLRAANLTPAEILSSESQERMCAVVAPENVDAFLAVCRKWDVLATVIGEVTDGDRLQITWHGETVVDVPPRTVAHEGPVYERPVRAPGHPGRAQRRHLRQAAAAGRPATSCRRLCLRCLAVRTCAAARGSPSSTTATCAATPCSPSTPTAACCASTRRPAAASRCPPTRNGRYTQLDPYAGAQLALAEAYRNVAVTGATPLAVTNCLNFGSPEDPGVMWQFAEAVRGLADGCAALGIPVTGGNVSFYNQTGDHADPARRRWSACSA